MLEEEEDLGESEDMQDEKKYRRTRANRIMYKCRFYNCKHGDMLGCIFPNADVDMIENYKMSAVWLSLEKEESPVDIHI